MKSAMPFKEPNKQVYIFLFLPKVDITRTLAMDAIDPRILSCFLDNEVKPQKPAGKAAKLSHRIWAPRSYKYTCSTSTWLQPSFSL